MNRTSIINKFIDKYNYKTYLEIGVRDLNSNFNKVKCSHKLSVDPDPPYPTSFNTTSDDFFRDH